MAYATFSKTALASGFGDQISLFSTSSPFAVGVGSGVKYKIPNANALPDGWTITRNSDRTKSINIDERVDDVNLNGKTLDGWNFSGYSLNIKADEITISNSKFDATGFHTVCLMGGFDNLTVRNSTFDGGTKIKSPGTNSDFVHSLTGSMNIVNNEFINAPADAVNTKGGVVAYNYFSGAGYQRNAHADGISVESSYGPVLIQNNYIDYRPTSGTAVHANSAIKIAAHFDNGIEGVTVEGNLLLGGNYPIYVQSRAKSANDIVVVNNAVGRSKWDDDPLNKNYFYDIYLAANERRDGNNNLIPDPDKGNLPPDTIYALNQRVIASSDGLTSAALWPSLPSAGSLFRTSDASGPYNPRNYNIQVGTEAADTLNAGASALDTLLRGLSGADTLIGGSGNDALTGGAPHAPLS